MTVYRETSLFPFLGLILISSVVVAISLGDIPRRSHALSSHGFKSDFRRKYGDSGEDPMERISRNNMEAMRKPGLFTNIEAIRGPHKKDDIPGRPHIFREHSKRDTNKLHGDLGQANEKENQELLEILKDDDSEQNPVIKDRKLARDVKTQGKKRNSKRKRESTSEPEVASETKLEDDHQQTAQPEDNNHKFQDWLRKEYYRNMAKSFATMRKKREMWVPVEPEPIVETFHTKMPRTHHEFSHSRDLDEEEDKKKDVGFEDVTDNLEDIKNALLLDVLKVYKAKGKNSLVVDEKTRRRMTNDIMAAHDIETVRTAFFRLAERLSSMENDMDEPETEIFSKQAEKRADQCPPLNVLTSDCVVLGDIVPDDSLKELLTHACNWHEVCYSCGEIFGLSSDNCDMGFVEKSRTICKGDVPCDTTASLLVMPLRQRRVFYKRSNPAVCLMDPCVEEFLTRA